MRFPLAFFGFVSLSLAVPACSGGDKGSGRSSAPPEIASASPGTGTSGTAVTIAGLHFGDTQGEDNVVRFGGVLAPVQSWSDASIVATVPTGAYPGSRDVMVVTGVGTSNTLAFTVVLPWALYINDDIPQAAGPNVIEAFAIAPNGAAMPIGTPAVQAVTGPNYGFFDGGTLAVDVPTRRVVTSGYASLTSWDIDPVTGSLTSADTFAISGISPYGILLNESGTRAYVADFETDQIVGVSIAADGSLAPLPGSPYVAPNGSSFVALSTDETYFYTFSEVTDVTSIFGYSVGADGSLTQLPGSPYDMAAQTFTMRRAPNADRYYVSHAGYITVYEPDVDGDLVENVALREDMPNFAYIAFDGAGDRLFAVIDNIPAPTTTQLFVFDVAGSGELVQVSGSPFTLTGFIGGAQVARANVDGTMVLVKDNAAAFHLYTVSASGLLTEVVGSPFALETNAAGSGFGFTF